MECILPFRIVVQLGETHCGNGSGGSHRFDSCLSDYNKLGDADRKAQALVPVCCFANKAIIRKAGNKYAIRKRNPNKS